jgi:hypothetical protein
MEYQHSSKLSTMKYYRFSRRRKPFFYVYDPKSRKKSNYMINTGRSKILSGIFFENQAWGGLHKAWKGYVIAKNKDEYDNMERYARIIQENQHELGLEVSSFDNIGRSAASFLWEVIQEENNIQGQEPPNEEYQTDRYEQERFTDTYNEDFQDDYDKVDRFTDDNAHREKFTDYY